MIHDLSGELFSVDGKLLRTMRVLLTRPGRLSKEYCAGRRQTYISPIRVYLIASALYFFVFAVTPRSPVRPSKRTTVNAAPAHAVPVRNATARFGLIKGMPWERAARANQARARADPAGFDARFASFIPQVLFAQLPVLALIFSIVFWRRGVYYPEHLVFTLHLQAVAFILAAATLLDSLVGDKRQFILIAFVVILLFVAYAVMAAQHFYGRRPATTWLRVAAVLVGYPLFAAYTLGMAKGALTFFY